MSETYPSFAGSSTPDPEYDCRDLRTDGYRLRVRCDKNNPDCQKFIADQEKVGSIVRTMALDQYEDGHNKIDIWTREKII